MCSPQLAGGEDQLAGGMLIGLVGLWILKCSAIADCTIDLRCWLSSAVGVSTVFVLSHADVVYFFIMAATCCDTSIDIYLDLVGLLVHMASLHMKVCVHQDYFVTTHSIHGVVHALASCICDVCDIVSVPLFCQYLVLNHLQQL